MYCTAHLVAVCSVLTLCDLSSQEEVAMRLEADIREGRGWQGAPGQGGRVVPHEVPGGGQLQEGGRGEGGTWRRGRS